MANEAKFEEGKEIFNVGDCVTLTGLSKNEWNGKMGIITENKIKNRWCIEIIGMNLNSIKKTEILIKENNIKKIIVGNENYLINNDNYCIKYLDKNRQIGMIANKEYNVGDIILSEEAMFKIPIISDKFNGLTQIKNNDKEYGIQFNKMLYKEFNELNLKDKVMYLWLSNKNNNQMKNKLNILFNIFYTNAYSLNNNDKNDEINDQISYLFHDISRINHSCSPNCLLTINYIDKTCEIIAIKKIHKNDEITSNYINNDIPMLYKHRKEYIYNKWGFNCICSLCNKDNRNRNDAIINKLNEGINTNNIDILLYGIELIQKYWNDIFLISDLHRNIAELYCFDKNNENECYKHFIKSILYLKKIFIKDIIRNDDLYWEETILTMLDFENFFKHKKHRNQIKKSLNMNDDRIASLIQKFSS